MTIHHEGNDVQALMIRPSTRSLAGATLAALMMLLGHPLAAQMPYAAANGQTSMLPIRHGYFSVDFAEAEFGLTFLKNITLGCGGPGCLANHLNIAGYTTAAARKGQRDLFTRLDFVPGFDVGARLAFVSPQSEEGHDAIFAGVTLTGHERDVIGTDPVTDLITLSEVYQRTYALSLGYNHAFSNTTILGISLEGRREHSSPGVARSREYCTPGTSPSGLRGPVCADRFEAPLTDLWTGHVRTDVSLTVKDLSDGGARLAMLGATSVDFVEDTTATANLSLGPSIQLSDHPGQPVVVLVVGLRDIFAAHDLPRNDPRRGNYFTDHVVFGLTLSAPFDILVGR